MSDIFCSQPLSNEHMAQMAFAMGTNDLCASTVFIRNSFYSTGDFIIKSGPSTTGIKFIFSVIKDKATLPAMVCSVYKKVIVLAGKGWLCAFVNDDTFFFRCQGVKFHFELLFYQVRKISFQFMQLWWYGKFTVRLSGMIGVKILMVLLSKIKH